MRKERIFILVDNHDYVGLKVGSLWKLYINDGSDCFLYESTSDGERLWISNSIMVEITDSIDLIVETLTAPPNPLESGDVVIVRGNPSIPSGFDEDYSGRVGRVSKIINNQKVELDLIGFKPKDKPVFLSENLEKVTSPVEIVELNIGGASSLEVGEVYVDSGRYFHSDNKVVKISNITVFQEDFERDIIAISVTGIPELGGHMDYSPIFLSVVTNVDNRLKPLKTLIEGAFIND